jgi:hypothetical protein
MVRDHGIPSLVPLPHLFSCPDLTQDLASIKDEIHAAEVELERDLALKKRIKELSRVYLPGRLDQYSGTARQFVAVVNEQVKIAALADNLEEIEHLK